MNQRITSENLLEQINRIDAAGRSNAIDRSEHARAIRAIEGEISKRRSAVKTAKETLKSSPSLENAIAYAKECEAANLCPHLARASELLVTEADHTAVTSATIAHDIRRKALVSSLLEMIERHAESDQNRQDAARAKHLKQFLGYDEANSVRAAYEWAKAYCVGAHQKTLQPA